MSEEMVIAFDRFDAGAIGLLYQVNTHFGVQSITDIPYYVIPRTVADSDIRYVHPITYMLLVNEEGKVFMYQRGAKGKENRLHDLYSVGIGGHVNPVKGVEHIPTLIGLGAIEELQSELGISNISLESMVQPTKTQEKWYTIYAGNDPIVGAPTVHDYHIGIVRVLHINTTDITRHEEGVISQGKFVDINDAVAMMNKGKLERWSEIVLTNYIESLSN